MRGKTGPVIGDTDLDEIHVRLPGLYQDGSAQVGVPADRLNRVPEKVDRHLLDLKQVDDDQRKVRCDVRSDRHMEPVNIGLTQFQRLLDDTVEATWRSVAAVKPHQRPQSPHHFSGALDLRYGLFGGRCHHHDIGVAPRHGVVHQSGVGASRH